MKRLLVCLLFSTAGLVSQAQVYLLSGPMTNPANGHNYYLTSPATWTDAEAFAVSMGAHLATVRNGQEDAWLFSTFTAMPGVSKVWLGLNDAQQEGNFVWSSAETATYRNWAPGEPNDTGGWEDYVQYFPKGGGVYEGLWNDAPDNAVCGGVVEVVPEPSGLALLALAAGMAILRGKQI